MQHKIEMHIVIEWDDAKYPYMAQTYLSEYEGKLVPNSEVLWDLHGGSNMPNECLSVYTAEHSAS